MIFLFPVVIRASVCLTKAFSWMLWRPSGKLLRLSLAVVLTGSEGT